MHCSLLWFKFYFWFYFALVIFSHAYRTCTWNFRTILGTLQHKCISDPRVDGAQYFGVEWYLFSNFRRQQFWNQQESTTQHHHHSWESSSPHTGPALQRTSGQLEADKIAEQDSGRSTIPPQAPPQATSSQSPSSSKLINQFVKDLSEEVVAVKGILDKQIRSQVETIGQLAVGSKSKELKTQV